jgi:propanol-preferring alcohol dehydrogenase
VANVTRRDAAEFLELAGSIPIRTSVREYPLAEANAALADLKAGAVGTAAAVLTTDA